MGCWRSASPPQQPPSSAGVTAVVAAAGSGQRLGAGGPKAFVPLAGRPMVEWSVEALSAAPAVAAVVVACPPGLGAGLSGHGVEVVDGGATRSESVSNALLGVETELVAIHDAARPLVEPGLLEGVIATLAADPNAAGAIAAAPVTDTIKRVAPDGPGGAPPVVERTVDRGRLWAAQTPQVFRADLLRDALAAWPGRVAGGPGPAAADRAEPPTDEAMAVEAAGGRVLLHRAPPENLKVTTRLDLRLAELLLAERSAE